MSLFRSCLIACCALTLVGAAPDFPRASAAQAGLESLAQADNASTTSRVKRWTRERFEAAKKRWARNEQKFSDCTRKLDELKKGQRLSLRKQGRFLEGCMAAKP